MRIELMYFGRVDNGVLKIANRKQMESDVRTFEGKQVIITIRQKYKLRSNQENRFLHGVVFPVARNAFYDLGNQLTLEEVKDFFKGKFLQYDLITNDGAIIEGMIKPTHSLSTVECEEFIENIRIWCRDNLNCEIPLPNEQLEIKVD